MRLQAFLLTVDKNAGSPSPVPLALLESGFPEAAARFHLPDKISWSALRRVRIQVIRVSP